MPENSLTVPTNPARALRELNRQPAVSPSVRDEPDDMNNTTILQSDKPTDRQADQPTNITTDRPTDVQTNQPKNKPTVKQASKKDAQKVEARPAEPERPARVDGRTLRVRQETADRTMVTSMRLAVSTIEALDEYCWRHRQRKQDVVQAALDLYFAAAEEEK